MTEQIEVIEGIGVPSPDDPGATLLEMKHQANYRSALAASMTKSAAGIIKTVTALTEQRGNIDKSDTAYGKDTSGADLAKLRERVDDRQPCLRQSLGDLADLADRVIRKFQYDIGHIGKLLSKANKDNEAASAEVASLTKELTYKQSLLIDLMALSTSLPGTYKSLQMLEKQMQDACEKGDSFMAYACANEIFRMFDEKVWIPAKDEYRDLLMDRWGEVVSAQKKLSDASANVADQEATVKKYKDSLDDLSGSSANRITELVRRWQQALKTEGNLGEG